MAEADITLRMSFEEAQALLSLLWSRDDTPELKAMYEALRKALD